MRPGKAKRHACVVIGNLVLVAKRTPHPLWKTCAVQRMTGQTNGDTFTAWAPCYIFVPVNMSQTSGDLRAPTPMLAAAAKQISSQYTGLDFSRCNVH